MNKHQI